MTASDWVDIELPKTANELYWEWFNDLDLDYYNKVGSAPLFFLAKKLEMEYRCHRVWDR
jgi:hypothetical protein